MMSDTLAAALRAAIYYFNPERFSNYKIIREVIMADPVILARSIGREPRRLILAPNPRTPIRVGKKEANINEH